MARSAKGHQDELEDDDEEEEFLTANTSTPLNKGLSLSISLCGLAVQHPTGFIDLFLDGGLKVLIFLPLP